MSKKYPGGIIRGTPVVPSGPFENSTAPGIWTLDQATNYIRQGIWPTAGNVQPDPFFENVTMLLHGDGTNGGQNNTFLDSSTNNFTITRNGNTTQGSFSPYGANWSVGGFAANGGSLQAPSAAGNFGSSNWTVEFWVNTTSGDGPGIVTQATTGGATNTSWGFFVGYGTSKNVALYLSDGSSYFASITAGTSPVADGAWHHVAASRSGSTAYLFLDGVLQGTASVGSTSLGNGGVPVHIGGQGTGTSFMLQNGNISNVRIVKGTALYTSGFTPSTTPLTAVSGTSLLTCQSNRYIDNSSNNYSLTVNSSALSVQRFSPFAPTAAYSTATIGGSGYFNGTTDYLNTPAVAALDLDGTNYTIEAWVYLDGSKTTNTMVFADPYYVLGISLNRTGAGDTYVYTGDGTNWTGVPALISSSNLRFRCWNHVAFVQNAVQIALYHNGVQVAATSNGGLFPSGFNGRMFVGAVNDATEKFAGYMSGVRITRSALYNSTFTPPATPFTQSGSLLLNYTNGAIFDNAMMNDLETVGNAQISTSVVKYGTGSLAFDGSGDSLNGIAASPNFQFGTGDFTVEMWVYTSNLSNYQTLLDTRSGDTQSAWCLFLDNTGKPYWYDASGVQLSSTAVVSNTWTHLAVSRSGSTLRMFLSGVQVFSGTNSNAQNPTGTFYVGRNAVNAFLYTGYIDDLRITKGVARYTANFTPPTAAFPDI